MIFDGFSYTEYAASTPDIKVRSVRSFLEFLEKKLGVTILYEYKNIPLGRPNLAKPLAIAAQLQAAGVFRRLVKLDRLPDEPPFIAWGVVIENGRGEQTSGASVESEEAAMYAAMAEGLERYLWFTKTDYFSKPVNMTVADMKKSGRPFISPERFVSFSESQREKSAALSLEPDAPYLWIQSESLVSNKKIYVPAQVVSPIGTHLKKEPLIRLQTTNGLATWQTRAGARLAGALELIERDAFMIMWFNQLTMPRIALEKVRAKSPSLDLLLKRCERYRFKVHAISMATDAPTHAICAVVEDLSGHAPRFVIGLRAHRDLAHAIEKATLEALRMRYVNRKYFASGETWDPNFPVDKIDHKERLYYWGQKENAPHLEFLIRGTKLEDQTREWDTDTDEEHLARIVEWCRESQYEMVSVPLGISAMNPTKWHVEMTVMPDLQPLHLMEWRRHLGGERLKSVPIQFGYTPLPEPFVRAPHPFC